MPPQAGPGGCKTPEECKSYCESNQEECKNFYPAGDQGAQEPGPNQPGTQMPPEGQMTQGQPCEGDGCQMGPLPGQPMQPGQEFLPEQNMQPPSGEPGSGGSLIPGEQVPLAPPTQQTPPEPGSFIINTDSFVGSLIYAAFKVLVSPHNF